MSEEVNLSESVAKLGRLAPIIKDADGNIIDGEHRRQLDEKWAEEFSIKLEHIKDPVQRLLARMSINLVRRTVPSEEKTKWLKDLKELTGWSADEIAEKTGMSKRWVLQYMPQELKEPEPEELARARLAREKTPETPEEAQIEEKPQPHPVRCVCCPLETLFPKNWKGLSVCPSCYEKLSRGEITLEPPKPIVEEAPKPPKQLEKRVYEPPKDWREEMHKPVSRMDQWVAEELSRRGIAIRSQEPICIKFVVPEVVIERGDKPLAVFLDTAETHGKRTLADMENRELLAKRGFRVLELQYDAYTEEQRQLIISEVMSAI